ncbi:MAG: sodium:solute symporter [Rhodospirillaceae bacterium]|nr:sodium:solute symporter [Rhodospirillaceae bacterium]
MLSVNLLLGVCLGYVILLFAVAFFVDRRSERRPAGWLHSPVVYTLSISVYCTSWTFYGAVGSAARNGLEFVTIYLGPTLVFVGWWWLLRKLVRIGRAHRVTSIADLISSRYGKSSSLAVLITLIAVIAVTPYIALQLQSVTRSYQVIAGDADAMTTAFWVAAGMALFTILFGTRNLDANERHHGVVAAIALEAIVKLLALIAVGVFVTYGIADGVADVFENVHPDTIRGTTDIFGPRWITLTFLSATAIICLPRQFQVTVVENVEERHLATASWLFPLYLFGMTIFIMPIALVGLQVMPTDANPDLFVLSIPLAHERHELALFAFLGGFSSATSMVIVAAIAVSTMVSNHIVMPMALRLLHGTHAVIGDVRNLLLISRRISIGIILCLGFLYFHASGGSDALAAIGLIAFVGVAQFLPSLLGGIFWRGATCTGALSGLVVGFALWAYTLFLPSFGGDVVFSTATLTQGPWGISLLRPQALLGLAGADPLVHAVIWSVGANALTFLIVSCLTQATNLERFQAAMFVNVFRASGGAPSTIATGSHDTEDLFILAQRILGSEPARKLFDELAEEQGTTGLPLASDAVFARLERELAGSIGAASAHAMVTRIAGRETVGMTDLIDIADETQQLIETSRQLSDKSAELEQTAQQLREVNERLRTLDAQKDEFLSQISHELRTPMTAIQSFSETLITTDDIAPNERERFVSIIHSESRRLTRLLDELLDISRLESGTMELQLAKIEPQAAIRQALDAMSTMPQVAGVDVRIDGPSDDVFVRANGDRIHQVLLNILSNAVKYNDSDTPEIAISTRRHGRHVVIDVRDNGGGVSRDEAAVIFEKFSRGSKSERGAGAGLGLPISRTIMRAMDGDLTVEFDPDGSSCFRLKLLAA